MNEEEMNKGESGKGKGESNGGTQPTTQNPEPIETLAAERDQYLAGWKRALADYENLQKQSAQMRAEDKRRVRISVAEDLLPVIDNFGYVMKHVPDLSGSDEASKKQFDIWFQGIQHIDRQFTEALRNLGVEPIESVGKPFDPRFHEAGGSKKDESKPDGVVIEEVIKGWRIGEVVIRPAKVIVNEI